MEEKNAIQLFSMNVMFNVVFSVFAVFCFFVMRFQCVRTS